MTKIFDICMIGLGPVGAVSGLCFAKQGFNVIGVDINSQRVAAFNNNEAPFVEPGVHDLIKEMQACNLFQATQHLHDAAVNSRIIMIAVGTPTPESGIPDFSFLDNVAESLGHAFLKNPPATAPIIVLRSTVPPGTMRNRLAPIIKRISGLMPGIDFHIAANPEFLREGMAIADFFDTGRIVIGTDNAIVYHAIEALYRDVTGQRIHTDIETAEFAKYVDNTWHALKVAFANEIGRTVVGFGGNVKDTLTVFLADEKLNLSSKYLQPGFAFGGSCLPKDVRGLVQFAKSYHVNLPVTSAIMVSNAEQIQQGVATILATGKRIVGFLGIAFKEGVDDLRESPALYVAQQLAAHGITILAHDYSYSAGQQVPLPTNNGSLTLATIDEVISQSELLVKFHNLSGYSQALATYTTLPQMLDFTTVIQETAKQ